MNSEGKGEPCCNKDKKIEAKNIVLFHDSIICDVSRVNQTKAETKILSQTVSFIEI